MVECGSEAMERRPIVLPWVSVDDDVPVLETDAAWMAHALDEARLARDAGEVPVGAVLVREGEIVARAHNRRELDRDPTAHAELLALRHAASALGTWRLSDVDVFVTLEPCPMCAGALVNARVRRVVFGALDPKAGATNSLYAIGSDSRLNHRFQLTPGVRADECGELLSTFFAEIRRRRRGT